MPQIQRQLKRQHIPVGCYRFHPMIMQLPVFIDDGRVGDGEVGRSNPLPTSPRGGVISHAFLAQSLILFFITIFFITSLIPFIMLTSFALPPIPFIILTFLFAVGGTVGWGIEVIYRRFVSQKHWVNPGFLTGPCLPLYGFSLCILYSMARMESYISANEVWKQKLLLFILMAIAITALEYVVGRVMISVEHNGTIRNAGEIFRALFARSIPFTG